ncbi:hypothetical protein [Dietzia maris]|uniref:hypothetical protein n=1 Tax=Dietzia maris TaxID=37915 RepID=UPI0037CA9CD9
MAKITNGKPEEMMALIMGAVSGMEKWYGDIDSVQKREFIDQLEKFVRQHRPTVWQRFRAWLRGIYFPGDEDASK